MSNSRLPRLGARVTVSVAGDERAEHILIDRFEQRPGICWVQRLALGSWRLDPVDEHRCVAVHMAFSLRYA